MRNDKGRKASRTVVPADIPGPDGAEEHLPQACRTIALMGLPGVGKTTVGGTLARRLRLPFVDTDAEIEAASGMSIAELFSSVGEPAFRAIEARMTQRILMGPRIVLSTGGGAVLDEGTRATLSRRAVTIWMRGDLKILVRRIGGHATRPLLRDQDHPATLRTLAAQRYPLFASSDLVVDVNARSRSKNALVIAAAIEAYAARLDA